MASEDNQDTVWSAAFDNVHEAEPESGLRPSLSQLADVAARRAAGDTGVLVTFLAAPDVGGRGWRPEQVHPLDDVVLTADVEEDAIGFAFMHAADHAPPGEQVFFVLHRPDGTWVVFPSLIVG